MSILSYGFMQKAFIVSVLLSILIPMIGVVIVLRRLSTTGEALSHTSLAGVAIGLVCGFNPIVSATIISIIAALLIEIIRKSFPRYSEIATNVVLSLGIGLAAVFSGFVKNAASFNSFLFGSLMAISPLELTFVIVLSIVVICVSLLIYKELMCITLDEESAKLSGVKVNLINIIFTVMTAVTVSIAARTVGALMISSLIVIPVACSMMIAKSYKTTLIYSILFALLFTIAGLVISYYCGLKPGGTIVLTGVLSLFILMFITNKNSRSNGIRGKHDE